MNTSRRTFIKNSSIALAGSAILPGIILHEQKNTDHILGIQLWIIWKKILQVHLNAWQK
jgi:hypothetical protein